MKTTNCPAPRLNIFRKVSQRYLGNRLNEHRLMLLAFVSISTLVGSFAVVAGWMGAHHWANRALSAMVFCSIALVNVLFMFDRLKLKTVMMLVYILTAIDLCGGMLIHSFLADRINTHQVMVDISLSITLVIVAVNSFLRVTPFVVCCMSAASFTWCACYSEQLLLKNYLVFYLIVLLLAFILGQFMVKKVTELNEERNSFERVALGIREKLGITQEQMLALMELSGVERPSDERQVELFKLIGQKAYYRLMHRVDEIMKRKEFDQSVLRKAFPELSPSELDICRLILRGKRLNEISDILQKSKSNITCQRTHIRTKLGLSAEDDLLEMLRERLRQRCGINTEDV